MRYVYLIRAGKDHYKVGIATNIGKRIKSLQTSNGNVIELITAIRLEHAAEIEKEMHESLRANKLNGGKEWFSLSPEQALDLAVLMNKSPRIDISDIQLMQQSIEDLMLGQKKVYSQMEDILMQLRYQTGVSKNTIMAVKKEKEEDLKKISIKQKVLEKEKHDSELIVKAKNLGHQYGKLSASLLQRKLSIGYAKAARIIDLLEIEGFVGPLNGIHRELLVVE
jgi:DNA segregation ATPase FtsK/SpoIIIE-like protein